MERRNRSLEALKKLIYINSLDSNDRAKALIVWVESYLPNDGIFDFDLELDDLKQLAELFYANISFLKKHKEDTRNELLRTQKMKKFIKHS
ncbi:hypothetical protein DZA35_01025 [Arcobacter sp. HD9-500m-PIT-SAG03]|nr:hypothetical protein DZA35_01025 [Arcobacter sp. HD9-500m-PIT-SAG03]